MLRPWLFAVAGTLAIAAQSQAQTRWQNLETNVKGSVGDAWDVWTSPLRGTSRDWLSAAGAIGFSAAVSPLDDNLDRWAVNHRDDAAFNFLKPVRPGGWAFAGSTITPVALGALALGIATNNQRLEEGLFGCATSYGASSVVRTFVVYPLLARTRPDPNRDNGPAAQQGDQYHFDFPGSGNWGQHATPGGHLANITACVTFLTSRYHMGKIVEPVLWATIGGVGIARTLDRAHWLSDETLGLFFGYAVGREVALRSSRRLAKKTASANTDDSSKPEGSFFLSPGANGTKLGWQIDFR
ncbi:MAG TPA: phosphatase PAP2 family protein [Gemmatimonadaceae bacterium]|jgi:membrane-associated phospholipid phosphatase